RFLVANLRHSNELVTLINIDRFVPDTEAQSRRFLEKVPRPRLIKSHQCYDARYKKVIYIVRDPRDVAISYYHFQRKYRHIADDYPIDTFVQRFVAGEASDYGSWWEHVMSWLGPRHNNPGFLMLRYEAMTANTEHELTRIANFLGLKPTPEQLAKCVEQSAAERVRKLEQDQGDHWASTKGRRKDIPFVGSAKVDNWKTGLPQSSVALIESAWGPLMKTLGYELSRPDSRPALEPPFVFPIDRRVPHAG
ncbi:MAG: sulfotransferase domain-containing protein, partial [Candidatus Acidiferrales bacterium]